MSRLEKALKTGRMARLIVGRRWLTWDKKLKHWIVWEEKNIFRTEVIFHTTNGKLSDALEVLLDESGKVME